MIVCKSSNYWTRKTYQVLLGVDYFNLLLMKRVGFTCYLSGITLYMAPVYRNSWNFNLPYLIHVYFLRKITLPLMSIPLWLCGVNLHIIYCLTVASNWKYAQEISSLLAEKIDSIHISKDLVNTSFLATSVAGSALK